MVTEKKDEEVALLINRIEEEKNRIRKDIQGWH